MGYFTWTKDWLFRGTWETICSVQNISDTRAGTPCFVKQRTFGGHISTEKKLKKQNVASNVVHQVRTLFLQTQNKFEKLRKPETRSEEISLVFTGRFYPKCRKKKYILVSVENNTRWPNAMFLPDPTVATVIEFLIE